MSHRSHLRSEDPEQILALALQLPQVAPPPLDMRARLLDLGRGVSRFLPFLERVARLFDLPEADTRQVLARIDDPRAYKRLRPGTHYFDVQGGPRLAPRHAGIVRMAPGARFPEHRHHGDEHFIILQGRARDSQGVCMRPGDEVINRDGSSHGVEVVGDEELLYAIVLDHYELV